MKKLLSIGTLILFLVAVSIPALAVDPPKDTLKTKSECPMKKGDKKCTKKCDKDAKSGCCKDVKKEECKKK